MQRVAQAASNEPAEVATRLLDEERTLKRIAVLIAQSGMRPTLLADVVAETGRLFALAQVQISRYTVARVLTVVAGLEWQADDATLTAPILVGATPWGVIRLLPTGPPPLPEHYQPRLNEVAQLVATAVVNTQSGAELRDLTEAQRALRMVATMVAQGTDTQAVFMAVAEEAARILGVGAVSLIRWDPETQLLTKIYGTHGERSPVPDGGQWPLDDGPECALVVETRAPVRIDDWTALPGPVAAGHIAQGFGQAVAAPIFIDGALWGLISAFAEAEQILPQGSETRLAEFTHLMGSAISNAQTREELRGLAEQQGAALRRIGTMVAQQAPPNEVFAAVALEAGRALGLPQIRIDRYLPDGEVTTVGAIGGADREREAEHAGASSIAAKIRETKRVARIDDRGYSAVAAPVIIDGEIWGAIVALAEDRLPDDIENRVSDFSHLVASSISNVHARNNLIASRARIVAASDETQRRIERNLHDGVQQRLVALGLSLRAVGDQPTVPDSVRIAIDEFERDLDTVVEEIRQFSQGLHPALLSRAGLGPSLRELVRRSPLLIALQVDADPRPPEPIETAVYYVVSEALANATKHARASTVNIAVSRHNGGMRATIADDGVGGAVISGSSGLIGLVDRIEALGGTFALDSPPGGGTTISIELPLGAGLTSDPRH
jgi:GAF domain-containing protein/two-component sensor histidine kinase